MSLTRPGYLIVNSKMNKLRVIEVWVLRHICRFELARRSASLRRFQQGRENVDLTLRLNVLVVCAIVVFLGAILFGAF
jgi:hypothetical protein